MALIDEGYLEFSELQEKQKLPDAERFQRGPVAVLECIQQIPCNPCEASCPFGAITVGSPITNLPVLDAKKCKGCGTCVAKCPGMAIFVVDKSYSGTKGSVSFPYEYYPLPQAGDEVAALNRKGEAVGTGKVLKVTNPASFDHTPVVTVETDLSLTDEVRNIKKGVLK